MNRRVVLILVLLCLCLGTGCGRTASDDVEPHDQENVTEEPEVHDYQLMELLTAGEDYPAVFECTNCHDQVVRSATFEEIGLPVLNIVGDISEVSKDNTVDVRVRYFSEDQTFESAATLKVQGQTSALYPKKNYTMKLLNEAGKKNRVELSDGWGFESKYCLKANYIDATQARNIVSAKLWGQVIRSRDKDDELDCLVNGGAIDGFPKAVYLEGEFLGLYTMNIPKDGWMMGMVESENRRQAMLFQSSWTEEGELGALLERNPETGELSGCWKVEFCSTADDAWIVESFNEFISFLNDSDYDYFEEHIDEYTDVDRAIDAMIYTCFIGADDNLSKNMIWVTFDGKKWIPSMYDMDSTWGLSWDGKAFTTEGMPLLDRNVLYGMLVYHYRNDIYDRIQELLDTVLTEDNIMSLFEEFVSSVPDCVYEAEREKWPGIPCPEGSDIEGVREYIRRSVERYGSYISE